MESVRRLLDFSDISPKVKSHLNQVYGTLAIGCMAATVGCLYTPLFIALNDLFRIACFFAVFSLVIKMHSLRGNNDHGTKFICFLAIASITGASLKPLVSLAQSINPVIVVNALVYTAAIFISFSLVSLASKRRSFLFLGGILFSIFIAMPFVILLLSCFGILVSFSQYNLLMVVLFSFYIIYRIRKLKFNYFQRRGNCGNGLIPLPPPQI